MAFIIFLGVTAVTLGLLVLSNKVQNLELVKVEVADKMGNI